MKIGVMVGLLFVAACVVSEPVGGVAETDSESQGLDGADESDSGDESGAVTAQCVDNPGSCASSECEPGGCGGPLSLYDEDGCLRPRCDDSGTCDAGRTCVRVGDYGSCSPSNWICEAPEGGCACGGTGDCSQDVSLCVPDALLPELQELVPSVEEYAQMCATASDQGSCADVPTFYDAEADLSMWCRWRTWVPITLGAGDVCEYGATTQECGIATASEAGCGEDFASCEMGLPALARTNAGQLEVSTASGCSDYAAEAYCSFSGGELVEGDPACICLCDDDFPD